MLELDDICVRIGGQLVIDSICLTVRPGEVTVLAGPNGAGKTTALRVLAGDVRPLAGRALMDGHEIASLSLSDLARRRSVMPQGFATAFAFTVRAVVEMGLLNSAKDRRNTLDEAMAEAGVSHLADRAVTRLSGGERQRVALARTLAQVKSSPEAGYLLLDEPTASLDLAHQVVVMRTARRAAKAGLGVAMVLHDLNLAAAAADQIVLLSKGRIAAAGAPSEILNETLISAVYETSVQRLNEGSIPILSVAQSVRESAAL